MGAERVAIYMLRDQSGAVRYIGQTRWPEQRQRQHEKVWPAWTMSLVQEVEASQADEVERRLIVEHEAAGCALANWVHTERARQQMREIAAARCSGTPSDEVQMTLRLTRAQHARLRTLADAESRSLHGEIVHFINEGMERREHLGNGRAGDDLRVV